MLFSCKTKKMWVFVNLWAYICNLFFFDKSIRNDCFAESVSLFPWNKLKQKINKTDIIKTSVGAHEVSQCISIQIVIECSSINQDDFRNIIVQPHQPELQTPHPADPPAPQRQRQRQSKPQQHMPPILYLVRLPLWETVFRENG